MTSPKGIAVRINTAEWISPAIERIVKTGEDLVELGVPTDAAYRTCESAARLLAIDSMRLELPRDGAPLDAK